jgi:hypothetical protein
MKRTLAVLVSLVAIILGALVAVPIIFGDKLISLAKEKANENLNAKIEFDDYDITVFRSFPDLTLVVNDLKITGVGEFTGVDLATVNSFGITVDLRSVISGNTVTVKGLEIDRPVINILVLENGKANYDIVKPSVDTTSTGEETQLKIELKEYQLENANITYNDKSTGIYTEFKGMDHSGTGDFTQDIFDLTTETEAESVTLSIGGVKYLNRMPAKVNAKLEMDMLNSRFTFKENSIQINKLELGLDGKIEMPDEDIRFDLSMKAKQADFKNLLSLLPEAYTKDFDDVKVTGQLGLNAQLKGVYNDKTMPGFDVRLNVVNGSVKYPKLPKSLDNINILATVVSPGGGNYDNTVIDVTKFHLDIASNPVDIVLNLRTPVSDPEINVKLLARVDLGNIKDVIPLENTDLTGRINADVSLNGKMSDLEAQRYEEFQAGGTLELTNFLYKSDSLPRPVTINNAMLRFTPSMLDLPNLSASFGQTKIQANGGIRNYIAYMLKNDTLQGNLYLRATKINLNEFVSRSGATPSGANDTLAGVIKVPRNINFEIISSIDQMIYDDIVINDFTGKIIVRDETVVLEKTSMKMLGGTAVVNGTYSTKTEPEFAFNFDINKFDISKTAKVVNTVALLAPIAKSATGVFSTQLEMRGKLDNNMSPIYKTLTGSGVSILSNVFIEGFEPFNQVAAKLKVSRLAKQKIADAKVLFDLSDGKLIVKPFSTSAGPIGIKIAGSTTITQEIDYILNLVIPRREFGDAANEVIEGLMTQANARGADVSMREYVDVDVFITNTVSNPRIKTNLKEKGKSAIDDIRKKMDSELKKKKDEAEERLNDEANKIKADADEKARQEKERLRQEAEKATNAAQKKADDEAEKLKNDAKKKFKNVFGGGPK